MSRQETKRVGESGADFVFVQIEAYGTYQGLKYFHSLKL